MAADPAARRARPRRPARAAGAAGFSILELLVAAALAGLIALGLSGGLRLGARAWEAQARAGARHADLDPVRGLLARLLAGSLRLEGDPSSLRAVAPLPATLGADGPAEVLLALAPDGRLLLGWRPWRRGQAAPPPMAEVELARDVRGLAIEYFGRPEAAAPAALPPAAAAGAAAAPGRGGGAEAGGAQGGGQAAAAAAPAPPPVWLPRWGRNGAPPLLVRVRLALPPGDPRSWPELVEGPRLATPRRPG